METNEIHRGRLIDHVHLVVRDLPASQRFYQAVFDVLGVPMGGVSDSFFWADELFVSTAASPAAQGQLTGRHHLAFQARDTAMVDAFHQAALAHGGGQWRARLPALSSRLLWRLRAGPGRQQYRGGLPWRSRRSAPSVKVTF